MLEKFKVLRHWKTLKRIYAETPKDLETALAKLDIEILNQTSFCKSYLRKHVELIPAQRRVIFDYMIDLKQLRNRIDVFMREEKKRIKVKQFKPIAEKLRELSKSKIHDVIPEKEYDDGRARSD